MMTMPLFLSLKNFHESTLGKNKPHFEATYVNTCVQHLLGQRGAPHHAPRGDQSDGTHGQKIFASRACSNWHF